VYNEELSIVQTYNSNMICTLGSDLYAQLMEDVEVLDSLIPPTDIDRIQVCSILKYLQTTLFLLIISISITARTLHWCWTSYTYFVLLCPYILCWYFSCTCITYLMREQSGEQSPVFFGSAMTNFGVELFLNTFLGN